MSKAKASLVVGLVFVGAFLAAFVPSLALGMRDEDAVSTTELTVSEDTGQTFKRTPKTSSNPQSPTVASPDVDPDCFGEGLLCKKERAADAVELARLATSVFESAGWPSGCFVVSILGGEEPGEKDALSVTVYGRSGLGTSQCREAGAGSLTKTQLRRLADKIKSATAGSDARDNIDLLQVIGGSGVDVQVPLK